MPNDNLLEKQQAAYVAALLMDEEMSPRAASKVADYSRRQSIDLAARRDNSGAPTHTQQVLLKYLLATLEHGMGPQARTTEAVIAAFPVAEPERITADIKALNKAGWRESNGYLNTKRPAPRKLQLLRSQHDQDPAESRHPQKDPSAFPMNPMENMNRILPPMEHRVGTDFLKEAALYHWAFRKPRPKYGTYVTLNEWPGRKPRIVSILLDIINEQDELDEFKTDMEILEKIGAAAEFILPFVTEPNTTRILCNIDNPLDQGQPATSHMPWPHNNTLYAELETPLNFNDIILHGTVALPVPKEGTPETWLVGLICQIGDNVYMPVASIKPDTGETECPMVGEHACTLDKALVLQVTAAVAHAVSGPLTPEPMNRQQRRLLQRKEWPDLWLIAESATG